MSPLQRDLKGPDWTFFLKRRQSCNSLDGEGNTVYHMILFLDFILITTTSAN